MSVITGILMATAIIMTKTINKKEYIMDDDYLEDWEREIINTFPLLYKDSRDYGIGVSKGWKDIIYELSVILERLCIEYVIQNPEAPKPRIAQIKSKFGGLRFYMDGATKEMHEAIGDAERKSYSTCEICGAAGDRSDGGWIMTLCDDCNGKTQKEEDKI